MPPVLARPRLDTIDALRGIAIVMVLLYHAWLVSGKTFSIAIGGNDVGLQFVAQTGFLGVEVFFFLSGFCLFHPYARHVVEAAHKPTLRTYVGRRVAKIVPSYLLALLALGILAQPHFDSPLQAVEQYVEHALFLHPLFGDAFQSISGPLWTVGVEVEFYVVFPLICAAMCRAPVAAFAGCVAVAQSYRWFVVASGHVASFNWVNQLPGFLDIFAGGMFAAYVVVRARAYVSAQPARMRVATVASCVAVGASAALLLRLYGDGDIATPEGFLVWQNAYRLDVACVMFALVVPLSLAGVRFRRAIANPVLLFFSTISYNLYLWHLEVLAWLYRHWPTDSALMLVPALGLAIGVATAITFAFERPLLRRAAA